MRPQTRWTNSIIVIDREGRLIQSWRQHDELFSKGGKGPHKIKMSPYDSERHVWIVDDGSNVIFKFTNDGKLVRTLGELGVGGEDDRHFGEPTDLDWLPDGTFFVSDGYVNARVVKFDKNGKFLMSWGQKPKDPKRPGPSEFNIPHSIAVGKDRRVYVVDRGHSRIQVFDENGKFLDSWPNIGTAHYHMISRDQYVWVGDGRYNRILKYDLRGQFLYGWGVSAQMRTGNQPGFFDGPHAISVDQELNLYIGEVYGGRVQKFVPKKGADPAKLIQPELRWPPA